MARKVILYGCSKISTFTSSTCSIHITRQRYSVSHTTVNLTEESKIDLAFPRHALATLLEMYCDFTPDKRYQLADWRIRCVFSLLSHL